MVVCSLKSTLVAIALLNRALIGDLVIMLCHICSCTVGRRHSGDVRLTENLSMVWRDITDERIHDVKLNNPG